VVPFNNRYVFLLATPLLLGLAFSLLVNQGGSGAGEDRRTAVLGTWTEGTGQPGNRITFETVASPTPAPYPGLVLYEGRVTFTKHLGEDEVRATWNYESFHPLRLNITYTGKSRVAAVKFLDHDHLLLRFVERLPDWSAAEVFHGPEVIRLTRLKEAERE
jgi:hypothetical protein